MADLVFNYLTTELEINFDKCRGHLFVERKEYINLMDNPKMFTASRQQSTTEHME
jgi:hypothetical protein